METCGRLKNAGMLHLQGGLQRSTALHVNPCALYEMWRWFMLP